MVINCMPSAGAFCADGRNLGDAGCQRMATAIWDMGVAFYMVRRVRLRMRGRGWLLLAARVDRARVSSGASATFSPHLMYELCFLAALKHWWGSVLGCE